MMDHHCPNPAASAAPMTCSTGYRFKVPAAVDVGAGTGNTGARRFRHETFVSHETVKIEIDRVRFPFRVFRVSVVDSSEIAMAGDPQGRELLIACFDVYKEMGNGYLEAVYQECLEIELAARGLPFVPRAALTLRYKGRALQQQYIPDFVCFGAIILEIKAITEVADAHRAQVHNYLKATGHRLGLLVNFGHHPGLQSQRIVR